MGRQTTAFKKRGDGRIPIRGAARRKASTNDILFEIRSDTIIYRILNWVEKQSNELF